MPTVLEIPESSFKDFYFMAWKGIIVLNTENKNAERFLSI